MKRLLILTILSCLAFQNSRAQVLVDTVYSVSTVNDRYPQWSSDGEMIVFESNREGRNSQIYSIKSNGTDIKRLTNNQFINETPVWSPNGKLIMYSSYTEDGNNYNNEIFIMNSDGTGIRQLTDHPLRDGHAKFSPNGKKIIFNSQREADNKSDPVHEINYEIYEMNIDGSDIKRLTNFEGWDTFPSYSPNGEKIVWRRIIPDSTNISGYNSEILLMNSDGTNITNLTNHKSFDGYPDWSPDGNQIVFTSNRHGKLQLFVMQSDGSGIQQITKNTNLEISSRPDWSSDGKQIVYNKTSKNGTSIHIMDVQPGKNIAYFNEVTSGILTESHTASRGVAWGDYDKDGYPDLLVANTMNNSNFLYKSDVETGFIQVVEGEPVTSAGWTEGVNWVDYDNDGDLDIFYTTQWDSKNELFRNESNGIFKKMEAGDLTSQNSSSTSACWCDYDLDGDLDVYVVERDGADDRLFNNLGNGNFIIVPFNKFPYKGGDGRTCSWGDINGDNYPELYVGNFIDKTGNKPTKAINFFYKNNQDGTFSAITNSNITVDKNLTYGSSFIDYDQDNDLDLFVTNISMTDKNLLFQNDGSGNFIKTNTIISRTRNSPSKGHTWGDFDNDGDLDLFISNGTEGTEPEAIMNFLFLSNGEGDFELVNNSAIVETPNISAGTAWADYDKDGDLDIFVTNWGGNIEKNAFYENHIYGKNWLEISLKGNKSNTYGIGAKVRLKYKHNKKVVWLTRWLLPQTGYASQNEPIVHFGLGSIDKILEIEIMWPQGNIDKINNITINHIVQIEEGRGIVYLD
jgi:Tol biopolymer transport system component